MFFTKFQHGKDKEGYWNNARAAIQTIDVVDCLRGIYPGVDIALLYDQSSGHAKKNRFGPSRTGSFEFFGKVNVCESPTFNPPVDAT